MAQRLRNSSTPTSREFLLPLEFEQSLGRLDFNEELGYRGMEGGRNQWMYALAISFAVRANFAWLAEFHANSLSTWRDEEDLVNFGVDAALNGSLDLLASVGSTLRSFDHEKNRVLAYAALQFHL